MQQFKIIIFWYSIPKSDIDCNFKMETFSFFIFKPLSVFEKEKKTTFLCINCIMYSIY